MASAPVYACLTCGSFWAVQTVYCPRCDSVDVMTVEPPQKPQRRLNGRVVGFSPIDPDGPSSPGTTS